MKMQHPETTPAIAAAVITRRDRVLLVRRRQGEGSLLWQFPAGAIEAGETASDAAVRETAEEVGLVVRASRHLGERTHPATGRAMVYIGCEHISGDAYVADTEELAEVAWATLTELARYVPGGLYEPVQEYLDRALAGRGDADPRTASAGEQVPETRADNSAVQQLGQKHAAGLHTSRRNLVDGFGR